MTEPVDIFGKSMDDSDKRIEAIQDFFKAHGINFKTDLNNQEIEAIIQIDLIHNYVKNVWGIDLETGVITGIFKELKVSHERKGRTEFVEMMKTFLVDTLGTDKRSIRSILGV